MSENRLFLKDFTHYYACNRSSKLSFYLRMQRTYSSSPHTYSMHVFATSCQMIYIYTVADILLCLLRLCMISGNFLHAAQRACDLLVLLGLERFSYRRGRSRPFYLQVLLHPCLHIVLAMYSEFIGIYTHDCLSPCASVTHLSLHCS
jgi:hypothetical protein